MAITFSQVWRAMANLGIPLGQAKQLFASLDLNAIRDTVAQRFRYEIWDGVSPVNNVPADEVRRAKGFSPDQVAYKIFVDGQLVILQAHHFQTGAPLTSNEAAEQAALEHLETLIEQAMIEEIVNAIIEGV